MITMFMTLLAFAANPLLVSGLRDVVHDYSLTRSQRGLAEFLSVGQLLIGTEGSKFGTAVEISTGSVPPLLAVGAPGYDMNVTLQGFDYQIVNAGAVFVYEQQPSDDWTLVFFLPGSDDEQIGDRFSMALADHRRIAVRRHEPSSLVQVYSISPMGSMPMTTLVGNSIFGLDNGDTLALSPDGNRVAVSSEMYSSSTGCVQTMNFNSTSDEWEPSGFLQGDSPNDQFGWRVAFDDTGDRLAISAPDYNTGGMAKRGLVRVFDYNEGSGSWVQHGDDLIGEAQGDQFGYSMDLSGDGMSLVVGAPKNNGGVNSTFRGVVTVFGLFGGNWVRKGSDLVGTDDNDRLGTTVAISNNGTRVIASSPRHDGDRGHVLVWDWIGVTWALVNEVVGDAENDQVGYGFQGTSLSHDGGMFAYGAVDTSDGIENGFVRVITEVPPAPSSAPSLFPTAYPTATITAEPSFFPSEAPVVVAWTIERDGPARIMFSEPASAEEIEINFIISNRNSTVAVFEIDCTTAVPSSVVDLNATFTKISSRHGNLSVALDVIQDTVANSSIWSMVSEDIGHLDLCIRVDLLLDDAERTSVNFRETVLSIDVDLNEGFNVSGIENSRDDPDVIFKNVTAEYSIGACQCDVNFDCINELVEQDSDLLICLSVDADGVEFASVSQLDFIQNSLVFSAIDDGSPTSITTTILNGSKSLITTRLVSSFFINPSPVTVRGVAILSFGDNTRRILVDLSRSTDSEFELVLELETSGAFRLMLSCTIPVALTMMLTVVGVLF